MYTTRGKSKVSTGSYGVLIISSMIDGTGQVIFSVWREPIEILEIHRVRTCTEAGWTKIMNMLLWLSDERQHILSTPPRS